MREISDALGLEISPQITGSGQLPSCYAVTDLAVHSFAAIGTALAGLMTEMGLTPEPAQVTVDRRLASLWFGFSIHPQGWELPPIWDPMAGDYEASDGWIRLHTNLPHHRQAALRVLGTEPTRESTAPAVREWQKDALETAIVAQGGVAAAMHSRAEWQTHPQGMAVAAEPLIGWSDPVQSATRQWEGTADRPLKGLRILDLTRVLAGPIATRTLAGYGAEVLRIDPPGWDEANVIPEVTLGKRCAHLDLKTPQGREVLEDLLSQADILVHGYRPGALDALGLDAPRRSLLSPGHIEITLDAYGWTGPWAGRRGFDSLVQMSWGIADQGMNWAGTEKPHPLPCQALDFATGYLMAAAAMVALRKSLSGSVHSARFSLARTAELLASYPAPEMETFPMSSSTEDLDEKIEETSWGPAKRLRPPLHGSGLIWGWDRQATELGASLPQWAGRTP
ncbi:CoA transferase [Parvularcula marina]|uniref:CoA transferase n=1 Tax=Parvularcula marina TaxID=2292771 RepID=UPI0035162536